MTTPILAPENAVTMIRGTSKTLTVTVSNPDGTPTNLTGGRMVLTVKPNFWTDLPLIQKLTTDPSQGVITVPREGIAEFYLVPADTIGLDTKEYVFDVWLVTATGERYAVVPPSALLLTANVTYLPI